MEDILIRLESIKKEYGKGDSKTIALNDVSLDIRKGEILCIYGKSGSGKSTLLNILGGMDRADSGRVIYKGRNTQEFSNKEMSKFRFNETGFIYQSYNLLPFLTAFENVELVIKDKEKSINALEMVGLKEKMDKFPSELSGGESQRVSIARAVVKDAPILLCDEPTGALDTLNSKNILILLERIAKEKNVTVVIVTHNPDIKKMSDRVVIMKDGKINEIIINDIRETADSL